jgi:dimethylhistidine N-methyltransferase
MDHTFAQDVISGLTSEQKHLSSKYFYDDTGSRIFREIMNMPEYYLTDCEFEILSLQAANIVKALQFKEPFNIIEPGPGDAYKTFKLLEYLVRNDIECIYVPIDISEEAISILSKRLSEKLPQLKLRSKVGDYTEILKALNPVSTRPSLLLFLGSNIGNYSDPEAIRLLRLFNDTMKPGDKLLIGMDLVKDPATIIKAYNDDRGITKRFNLNLLRRINREFKADFNLDAFDFYCHYDSNTGELKSYIVSLVDQQVNLKKLNTQISFKKEESIWTELSKKYDYTDIDHYAKQSHFKVIAYFQDRRQYFTISLWEK